MTISGAENTPPRNGRGGFVRRIESAERDGEACRLHAQGWTIREISEHLGYGSPGNAHRGIQRALAEAASLHGARELREQMIAELSLLRRKMWELIESPPPLVDRLGHVVTREDGCEVPDAAAMTNAASTIIRADDRLARLTGIDAPKRSMSVLASISPADLQAHLAALRAELLAQGIDPDEVTPRAIAGGVEDSADAS